MFLSKEQKTDVKSIPVFIVFSPQLEPGVWRIYPSYWTGDIKVK